MQPTSAKRRRVHAVEHQIHSDEIIQPEMDWNDDMYAFYSDPWSLEMDDMNDEPVQWSELSYSPVIKCSMCGNGGHQSTSCPNSCCLKCGEKTSTFQDECARCSMWSSAVCEICGHPGHIKGDCPNHWKCYHSTIDKAASTKFPMLENPRRFNFNWGATKKRGGGFYKRFINAITKRVPKNWS